MTSKTGSQQAQAQTENTQRLRQWRNRTRPRRNRTRPRASQSRKTLKGVGLRACLSGLFVPQSYIYWLEITRVRLEGPEDPSLRKRTLA